MKNALPHLLTLILISFFAAPARAQITDDFGQAIDTTAESEDSYAPPAPPAQWAPPEFATVRAYLYGLKGENEAPVYHDGRLDKSVSNKKGILLSPAQVQELLAAISPPDSRDEVDPNMCYVPHHGFVFFDAGGKAVAQCSPCLMCKTMEITPPTEGLAPSYRKLEKLIRDLGMPVFSSLGAAKAYKK